jgi:IS5 family transposase
MRPRIPAAALAQDDLFRSRLDVIIDLRHPLVRLARAIDWSVFDEAFDPLFDDKNGAPALPTRLMVGLHMIKHMDGISDEKVCARFLDSPYVQYFCGEAFFRHDLVLDRSSMTHWRQRIGAEALEILLAESLAVALRAGAVSERHLERITVDTTVQEKDVTPPTDAGLILRALEALVRLAKMHGIKLRQSYARLAKYAARKAGNLFHRGRHREGLRQVKWLRIRLGRIIRDIGRKIAGNGDLEATFAEALARAETIKTQKAGGQKRIYSFHALEVECIAKGKARKRFEFGVKVSVAVTNALAPGGLFVVGCMAMPGNPYDGHTLAAQLKQTTRITGIDPERVYVDRGYRGHDAPETIDVFIAHQKRGLTPTIRRELNRRNGIEPVIGHLKSDGLMDRCFLKGPEGDAINAILCAAGHNLRLLVRWFLLFLAWIRAWITRSSSPDRALAA